MASITPVSLEDFDSVTQGRGKQILQNVFGDKLPLKTFTAINEGDMSPMYTPEWKEAMNSFGDMISDAVSSAGYTYTGVDQTDKLLPLEDIVGPDAFQLAKFLGYVPEGGGLRMPPSEETEETKKSAPMRKRRTPVRTRKPLYFEAKEHPTGLTEKDITTPTVHEGGNGSNVRHIGIAEMMRTRQT